MTAHGAPFGRFRCRCGLTFDCSKHLREHREATHAGRLGYGYGPSAGAPGVGAATVVPAGGAE